MFANVNVNNLRLNECEIKSWYQIWNQNQKLCVPQQHHDYTIKSYTNQTYSFDYWGWETCSCVLLFWIFLAHPNLLSCFGVWDRLGNGARMSGWKPRIFRILLTLSLCYSLPYFKIKTTLQTLINTLGELKTKAAINKM